MRYVTLGLLAALIAITAATTTIYRTGTAAAEPDSPSSRDDRVQQATAKLKAHHDEIFNDPRAPIKGNPSGDVTVVEFMDYNCGYCRKTFPALAQLLEADPKVRVLYKEYPVLGPNSEFAARAALAAHRQGRYNDLHNAMMRSKQQMDERQVLAVAERIGLDMGQLKNDMDDPEIQQIIDDNRRLAQALDIDGTPTFVLGDYIVHGVVDLAMLQRLITEARQAL